MNEVSLKDFLFSWVCWRLLIWIINGYTQTNDSFNLFALHNNFITHRKKKKRLEMFKSVFFFHKMFISARFHFVQCPREEFTKRPMHVTGIIADNFQVLVLFKFESNYEFIQVISSMPKIAVEQKPHLWTWSILDGFLRMILTFGTAKRIFMCRKKLTKRLFSLVQPLPESCLFIVDSNTRERL